VVSAILLVLMLFMLGFAALTLFSIPGQRVASREISFSELLHDADEGKVRDIAIQGRDIQGTYLDGHRFQTFAPDDLSWIDRLRDKGVVITRQP
jgi:cell division protease FtsH